LTSRHLQAALLAAVLAATASNGCGPETTGVQGTSCTGDGDCNAGLKCLPYLVTADSGTGCVSTGNECLLPCHADADCTAQGPGLMCLTSCGGTPACVIAVPAGVAEGGEAGGDAPSGD
jgi:hypothetical protein